MGIWFRINDKVELSKHSYERRQCLQREGLVEVIVIFQIMDHNNR